MVWTTHPPYVRPPHPSFETVAFLKSRVSIKYSLAKTLRYCIGRRDPRPWPSPNHPSHPATQLLTAGDHPPGAAREQLGGLDHPPARARLELGGLGHLPTRARLELGGLDHPPTRARLKLGGLDHPPSQFNCTFLGPLP